MSFYDSLRKNLTPELFTQITDQLGDDFDFDLVPRSRLNKVIKQRNALRDQIEEGSQPSGKPKPKSKKGDEGDDDDDDDDYTPPSKGKADGTDPVDVEALKKQWEKEQGDKVAEVKMQFAVLEKLRESNAIDPELIWSAGLIDKSKITFDETGEIQGVDEAVEAVAEAKKHLFSATSGAQRGTGKQGGEQGGAGGGVVVKSVDDFVKLSSTEQSQFKQANPEMFQSFLSQM